MTDRQLTTQFTDALSELHASRDVEPLVELFAEDATLEKLDDEHTQRGPDGARKFWQEYRAVFEDIEATFTHTIEGGDSVALEWTSTGNLSNGRPFAYRGISVLDFADGRIAGFRTYYDSAAFLPKKSAGVEA